MLPLIPKIRLALAVASVAAAVACATTGAPRPADPASPPAGAANQPAGAANQPAPACEPYGRTELFFGTTRAGAPPVSDQEFHAFLDSEVTPRFPDGLTVLSGYGQFRGSDGKLVQERSMVLIVLYPRSAGAQPGTKIDEIRQLYRQKFNQESVLRSDDANPPCVSF